MSRDNPDNDCFHVKVGLNALDSPQIDVAVLVPARRRPSATSASCGRPSQVWEGGIDYLADEMGLDWLRDGVDFNISGRCRRSDRGRRAQYLSASTTPRS